MYEAMYNVIGLNKYVKETNDNCYNSKNIKSLFN